MIGAMSAFLNRNEPATSTVAPASTHTFAVSSLTPPSTEISRAGLCSSAHPDAYVIFGTQSEMKDCPPNPGWTVMTRTMSTRGRYGSILSTGVSGLTDIPAFSPLALILSMAPMMSPSASQCTVIASHPASANASTYLTGSSIIRWASKNFPEDPLTAFTTGGPNVMLGTNIPSITSRWIQSAPALSTLATSSPSFEKSADRMDGDTLVIARALA